VVRTGAGRGGQLRVGAAAAAGEWLLVLHADARVTPEALDEVVDAVSSPAVECACWPLAIEGKGVWFRAIEWSAALRWRVFGLAYGDQGLLVRRSLYDAAGGYPEVEIMEDVILIRRLRRLARVVRFRTPLVADQRRWMREGPLRASLRNIFLLALFLAGASPNRLARWYAPEQRPR
jgi:cellulose synthase/poly-beta-1,6-N-acetylglucosamine synthase-like glycosyltransferase